MNDSGVPNPETNSANNFAFTRDENTAMSVDGLPSATTNIVNDAEVVHAKINKHVFMDNGLAINAKNAPEQTIKSFLAKPYPIQQGLLSSTDTSSTFAAFDPISAVLTQTIYKNKIDGHLGFKATTLVRLQINAERFQQGRYILAFLPFNTSTYTGTSNSFQKMHTVNLTTVTQLPHVEIDLNCDTEAVLEIPYVSPASHYSIIDQNFSVGTVFLYPYIPLTTGSTGSTACEYTIWVSYKDVELAGPTVHQGNFEFQAGKQQKTQRGRNATEIERDSVGAGPISQSLYNVSKATDILSEIPLLSAIAKPVSWFSDIVSRVASIFGWSNPIDLSPVHRMVQTIFPYANNCDAVDESMPISLFSQNLVEPYSGFAGTDIDEMAIDFIKTIPAYVAGFNFTTSSVANTVLYTNILDAAGQKTTGNDGTYGYYVHTPVSFLANQFQLYRGSLKLTFKCAKTEFHSGRLLVAYAPYTSALPSAPTLADTTYLHREIIDLRMGNEFSFVLPYASVVPFRDISSTISAYGVVWVYVLNELVAPASVSSTVSFVVEVSAASDMEFAIPRNHTLNTYVPFVIQSNFEFQMDSSFSNSCSIIDKNIGSAELVDDGFSSDRLCVGERIMSILSLLKKSDTLGYTPVATTILYFAPYGAVSSTSTSIQYDGDNYSLWSAVYGLSRGGIRVRVPLTSAASNVVSTYMGWASSSATSMGVLNLAGPSFSTNHSLKVTQDIAFRGGVELQVPQYSKYPVRVNSAYTSYGTGNYIFSIITSIPLFLAMLMPTTFTPLRVERAVADDFQFGYFISTVPSLNPY
jgi:hypothetical protein